MIARGFFTTHLISELTGAFSLPIGDNDAPTQAHGWAGEPNATASNFTPWIVVAPGTAARSEGSMADPQQDWRLNYFFSACGVSRQQTESIADKIRTVAKGLNKQLVTLKDESWKLTYVHVVSIGAVSRQGATNPPYHLQTDTLEFWLSKEI